MTHQLPKEKGLDVRDHGKERAHQATPDRLQDSHQAGNPGKAQPVEQGQEGGTSTGEAKRLNWEAVAAWVFVGFCFATLLFAGYLLCAKCERVWPF